MFLSRLRTSHEALRKINKRQLGRRRFNVRLAFLLRRPFITAPAGGEPRRRQADEGVAARVVAVACGQSTGSQAAHGISVEWEGIKAMEDNDDFEEDAEVDTKANFKNEMPHWGCPAASPELARQYIEMGGSIPDTRC
jgi:hypothetical protein